ncbi:nuclear transport factor 2 family protein [Nocardia alni]|uniref:nuclear transport factor 2 family protein n=1 Tax=Nocardia alni TaxID=2815723 RepID=UPI001C23455E|nr:nuclear transport factor 2 family protein [Nocardia alni]
MTTAVDVFTKMAQVLARQGAEANDSGGLIDLCADDVVFEFPFAPPGRPTRVEGKTALGEYLRALSGRMRIEGARSLEIHETVKPDVAIIEMTLTGTVTASGAPYEQSYVVILTVRDGLIAHYRDYWNPLRSAE